MNSLLNGLIRSAISLSLHDREAFIRKTAEMLEGQTPVDADLSQRIASFGASLLETSSETLLHKQLTHEAVRPLEEKIDRLLKEVEELKRQK